MKFNILKGAMIGAFAFAVTGSASAQTLDDELLATVGEFEISNSNPIHDIFRGKADKHYRICASKTDKSGAGSSAISINYDGNIAKIMPGNCTDIVAKHIKITPAGRLGSDDVLIGRYSHVN